MSKRIYKFISAKHAISNLKDRRLKVSTIDGLNDPFDHYAIDTTDPGHAFAVTSTMIEYERNVGIVCFSRNWDNLLLWSHYADSHRGVCLGFDIADDSDTYLDVRYQPNLLRIGDLNDDPDFPKRMLSIKHESWSYEQEVRIFVGLSEPPDEDGRLWIEFGSSLDLKEVIVGVQCTTEVKAGDAFRTDDSPKAVLSRQSWRSRCTS